MDILKIAILGVATALLALVLRSGKRAEIALVVALAGGVAVLALAAQQLGSILSSIQALARRGQIDEGYIALAIKIVGIALIAEFGAVTCRDAGEAALAHKIEFGGKIAILAISLPLLWTLMDLLAALLP